MSGARVVPIFWDSDKETLSKMMSKINGIIFPGGATDIMLNSTGITLYFKLKDIICLHKTLLIFLN